jgi:hypothetical protein
MRLLAAKTVPFMAGLRAARGAGPALLAVLLAVGAVLAIAVPALTRHETDADRAQPMSRAKPSGETVVRKFAEDEAAIVAAEPPSVSHLMAMATSTPNDTPAPPRKQEEQKPNLSGLSEIPHDLIWNRQPDEEEKAEPKAFAAFSKARENLPWDAVEPVPFAPLDAAPEAAKAQAQGGTRTAALQPVNLPNDGQIESWVKAKATEIKGLERERPLYHFELWLEPPADVKRRLVGVAYAFSTPAVMPQQQASSDQASGFRISAGGLACADEITLTLRFDDGQTQKVDLDGCKLFR